MLKYGEYTWSQAKKKFSSPIGHSGAHCCKLRMTFGFSRTDNCNKIYIGDQCGSVKRQNRQQTTSFHELASNLKTKNCSLNVVSE